MSNFDTLKTPQVLDLEKLSALEDAFLGLDPAEQDDIWTSLNDYFKDKKPADDRKYWYGYFRWYTDLTWRRLIYLKDTEFLGVAIYRQIPMAILLNIDVWKEIMWYFEFHPLDRDELRNNFAQAKEIFFTSPQVVGEWKGKPVLVADLVKEITMINNQGNDSFAVAEMMTKIKTLFYPPKEPMVKFLYAEPDTAIGGFYDLVHFFIGVDVDKIEFIVDAFVHPEKYSELPTANDSSSGSARAPSVEKNTNKLPTKKQEVNVSEVMSAVDTKFKKTPDGQYEDVGAVLSELQKIAEEKKDPSIAELYYFDEKDNRFKWKSEG